MREIWIPELLASFFTLLFLIRPLFKGLWPLDGIAWFPILSLGVAAALFPAYGFRPECLPLLIYQGIMALISVKPLLAGVRFSLHGRSSFFTFPALAILVFFTGIALWFAPRDLPPAETRLVRIRGGAYALRIFDARPSRGLIFLVPPEFGGLRAVDSVCAALADRGFSVIAYNRSGLRSPREMAGLWSGFRRGTVLKKANGRGRALEEEKRREIEFILPYVRENLGTLAPAAEGGPLFLAGWGPGGSALYYLASEQNAPPGRFSAQGKLFDGVRGLVTVESRLWSAWEPEPPPADEAAADQNPLLRGLALAGRWFARFRPEKIKGPAELRSPAIPLLCLVSDRAFGGEPARRDYAALFDGLRNSRFPTALAALEGAGPLDYSDFPAEYPLYSALFPGLERGSGLSARNPGDTAAVIARFCDLAAGAEDGGRGGTAGESPSRPPLRLETRDWNLGDLRLY
ncbi:MAG: hypothetical protein LBU19_07105 [Treponema sp.]|jgi:hypothetical protein|nr:hypothetical protein [Treponema sp.]